MIQGKRKRGRQKKKWTDNIMMWTKKTFTETQAVAHNHGLWTQLVQQSVTLSHPVSFEDFAPKKRIACGFAQA